MSGDFPFPWEPPPGVLCHCGEEATFLAGGRNPLCSECDYAVHPTCPCSRREGEMTWSATYVPVDESIPPEEFSWSDTRELAQKINADTLDMLTMRQHGFQVVVDDTGLIDGKPINQRVTRLVGDMGYPGPIAGDVALIGVTEQGYEADSPIGPDATRLLSRSQG